MTALTILSTEIRQLDGLYSLNDLHKAAGGKDILHTPCDNCCNFNRTAAFIVHFQNWCVPIIDTQ